MRITDELRKYAEHCAGGMGGDALRHIADHIDAAHERALRESYDNGYASADDWLAQHEDAMAEHGWVKLPVDADGVPIRVGDVLDPPVDCDDYMPLQVVRLTYDGYEEEWYFDGEAGGFCGMVGEHMDVAGWTHHHATTVEDVLREFAEKMNENLGMYMGEAIDADEWRDADAKTVAEFAAKLRLAECATI